MRTVTTTSESWPLNGTFTISRGSKSAAEVVLCTIVDENHNAGRGECVPYARYGETLETVLEQIRAVPAEVLENRAALQTALPAGAARNALDCALWDFEAKTGRTTVAQLTGNDVPSAIVTAYTLSMDTPKKMEENARRHANRQLLKAKVGQDGDAERIRAIRTGAPNSRVILDANEGWHDRNIEEMLMICAELHVDLVEQPLPAGKDNILADIERPVPVCADESAHTSADLKKLVGLYDCVNIKLDKAGGLTEALIMRDRAREMGFQIMIGCMVGTSLAMAPAVLLAQEAIFTDLDGPLLLAKDRENGLTYDGDTVAPPSSELWG